MLCNISGALSVYFSSIGSQPEYSLYKLYVNVYEKKISMEILNNSTKKNYVHRLSIETELSLVERSFAKLLKSQSKRLKAVTVLYYLQTHGVDLYSLGEYIFNPRSCPFKKQETYSETQIKENILPKIITELRGSYSLKDFSENLNISNVSTYHHYEKNIRDLPFEIFLRILNLRNKFEVFLGIINIKELVSESKTNADADLVYLEKFSAFSQNFFSKPWTPTIYLMVQLPKINLLGDQKKQINYIKNSLKLSHVQVAESLETLMKLKIIDMREGKILFVKGQFFNPPKLSPKKIDEIHQYWFSKSLDFLNHSGFHRVEQHTVTEDTQKKILSWISDLREKIKNEVNSQEGEPDRLIHINWSLTEIANELE